MFTKRFWAATLERMIRAFAACAVALLSANKVGEVTQDNANLFHVNLLSIVQVSLTTAVVSMLFSLAAGLTTNTPGPSLTGMETTAPAPVPPAPDLNPEPAP